MSGLPLKYWSCFLVAMAHEEIKGSEDLREEVCLKLSSERQRRCGYTEVSYFKEMASFHNKLNYWGMWSLACSQFTSSEKNECYSNMSISTKNLTQYLCISVKREIIYKWEQLFLQIQETCQKTFAKKLSEIKNITLVWITKYLQERL